MRTALANLGQHRLIAVKSLIIDMIAGLMLELGNQLGINVVAPVIDRQGFIAAIVCFLV